MTCSAGQRALDGTGGEQGKQVFHDVVSSAVTAGASNVLQAGHRAASDPMGCFDQPLLYHTEIHL